MIELIDLTEWKTQKVILLELHREYGINLTSREWRIQVEKWNRKFKDHEVDYYITHSNSLGYKATRNYQEAKIGRNDYVKRALDMLKKAKDCDIAFGNMNNLRADLEKGEII